MIKKNVNDIFKKVVTSIDNSRNQILDIVDEARKKYEALKIELEEVSHEIEIVINNVDNLEIKDKIARQTLAKVSKNFKNNSEENIKAAYDKAYDFRIKLEIERNNEKVIREKRSRLEISLKAEIKNINNAEQVVNQITVVSSYLRGEIMNAIEEVNHGNDMMVGVRILEAQENERARISRDIHDGPAQRIANIVMKADLCEKIANKNIKEGLKELSEVRIAAKYALKEVRDIIYNLRPMSLDDLGLNKTIEMNAKSLFEGTNVNVDYKISEMNKGVESIIQVAVFRVVQEILNNIKKHSEATSVFINIDYGTKYLRIIIGDNGKGFDYKPTIERVKQERKSYGLLGMIERVKQLSGEFNIETDANSGTTIIIKLPINREVLLSE